MNKTSLLTFALAGVVAACGASDSEFGSANNAGPASYDGSLSYRAPSEGDPLLAAGGAPAQVPTNPFVVVAHDPLSTFAADVDTASYDYFRSEARYGSVPPPDFVRLEEFVNYFDYGYEPPELDAEHPFSIHLEAAPNLVTRDTTLVRVGIKGKELPPDETKKPANLVFLVDSSGSMSEELESVQHTLRLTLDVLDPTDTISIVTYAGSAGTVLEATPVSERDKIERAIQKLESGGSTNGSGGITAAYAEAESAFIEDGINHVLICTDGDFNVGLTSDQSLEDLIVEKRKTGITLTVLGYGTGNYNDSGLERISNAGNGIAGYIGNDDDAEKYVKERMLQTLVQIAKDMKIQVEFNPEHVYAYRLLGYENRAIADDDFRNDVIDAGDIGAGHSVTALYEVVFDEDGIPTRSGAPALDDGELFDGTKEIAAEDLVLVKVRYKEPGAQETDPAQEVSSSLTPDVVAQGFAGAGTGLQWAAAVAAFAELLKASPYADEESLDAIDQVLQAQKSQDDERAEFADLFTQVRSQL